MKEQIGTIMEIIVTEHVTHGQGGSCKTAYMKWKRLKKKTDYLFGMVKYVFVCMVCVQFYACRTNLAKESGFTGLSALHRLNALYGFNVLIDLVFDAMHNVTLNVLRMHLHRYVDEKMLPKAQVEKRLNEFPWTAGILCNYFYINNIFFMCVVQ